MHPSVQHVCEACGKSHEGLPTDYGYNLPDVAWNQPEEQRHALLDWSTDISFFEGKWFIRGLLGISFQFQSGRFGWGVWAELSEETMARYQAHYHSGQVQTAIEDGLLANALPEYENTIVLTVAIQFGAIESRPFS